MLNRFIVKFYQLIHLHFESLSISVKSFLHILKVKSLFPFSLSPQAKLNLCKIMLFVSTWKIPLLLFLYFLYFWKQHALFSSG